ncbi:twin-arginine translocation signal domain-containing protein [Mesorhizobium sp. B2-3-3]|nr:twin-arginine translocation signal domain-containing protein [Mesorhizobium sp. B2-3-3]
MANRPYPKRGEPLRFFSEVVLPYTRGSTLLTVAGVNRRNFLLASGAAAAACGASAWPGLAAAASIKNTLRIYGDPAYFYRRALPLEAPRARFPGFKPGQILLKKGTIRREGAKPLPCDIIRERDVPLKLRDGTTIYTDVFRPAADGKYPAIVV